jgi:hypothetical protein
MINHSLRAFVDRVLETQRISADDVHQLQRVIIGEGMTTREEADVLVALDRAVPDADEAWADFLVTAVAEFVVWTSRPTGYVDHDGACWLVTTLSCGAGPTRNAGRIAFGAIKEAQQVDEALLAFALRASSRRPQARPASGLRAAHA